MAASSHTVVDVKNLHRVVKWWQDILAGWHGRVGYVGTPIYNSTSVGSTKNTKMYFRFILTLSYFDTHIPYDGQQEQDTSIHTKNVQLLLHVILTI